MNYIYFFFCILSFNLSNAMADYSIVFIHIGLQVPHYVVESLAQARLFNKHAPIYLVINMQAQLGNDLQMVLKTQSINTVFCESLKKSESHKLFLQTSKLDQSSKDGFWLKTSERFFYLDELITDLKLKNVFHLENDNMLYVDFAELLSSTQKYTNIAGVFDNDDRCIPSIVFIKHSDSLKPLVSFFAQHANQGLNDMQIPALFKREYGHSFIDNLPIVMPEYLQDNQLVNALGNTVRDGYDYCRNFEDFNSIFDGAALGQFLGGTDPGNGPNAPGKGFINESCVINPSFFTYVWIADGQNRLIPFLEYRGKKYRINNLHIHSKNLKNFRSEVLP